MSLTSISNLIESVLQDSDLKNHNIMLVRQDGLVLYSNVEKSLNKHSFGALVGGVWQAAETLSNLVESETDDIFRLNFGTSSKGIYILPVSHGKDSLYLSLIFKDEVNPAKIRYQMQNVRSDIQFGLDQIKPQRKEKKVERKGFLFSNITDAEMDQLFNITRN
jgi:predicted regulator of Ras-like GTPase activity (Roadblock/LC7/MglB family)